LAVPPTDFSLVDDFSRYSAGNLAGAYRIEPDGDPNVRSEQAVSVAEPPDSPPEAGVLALKIAYRFAEGWKFVRLVPQTDALRKIEGQPKALGLWIHGDGSGVVHYPIRWDSLFLIDSAGRRQTEGEVHIACPTLIR